MKPKKPKMNHHVLSHATAAVDPTVFLAMMSVWENAANVPLRAEGWTPPGLGGLYLTDIPINRSAMAVVGELKRRGIEEPASQAYLMRLIHFGEMFEERARFAEFLKPGSEEGALLIASVLLEAFALADLVMVGDQLRFDVNSVLSHARRLEAEQADVAGEGVHG